MWANPALAAEAWASASTLAVEAAVEDLAERLAGRLDAGVVSAHGVEAAVVHTERRLGRALTVGQRDAVHAITTSGRGLDLVVGVVGSGKTTALDVARGAFEDSGHRVIGTAISGQAAKALREEAGVEARTIASIVWRLEHDQLRLDDHTVLLIDEAGMADDVALLKLLAAADVARSKVAFIGDHRQLGAIAPGRGLEALIDRHADAVHVLGENVRQHEPAERKALDHLRAVDVVQAIDWFQQHDRIVARRDRDRALEAAVDAWEEDIWAGKTSVLLAWRRRPEPACAGARGLRRACHRAGDRGVTRKALRGR